MNIQKSRIFAAEGDEDLMDEFNDDTVYVDDEDGLADNLDDMADSIDDMQEAVEDVVEDDTTIDVDNNIIDHYIAECDTCKGIFISAVVVSDQDVKSIKGTCPLCGKDTEQSLKWVIKSANDVGEDTI